jgi:mono/diheme cytochrome c family protein
MRLAVAAILVALAGPAAADDLVARGEYLTRAGGCFSCHTAPGGAPLAGGRALETPFGTFFSPNITPDPETGIGRWSDADFRHALRNGRRPDGASYFPVFPYPSFSGITDDDLAAMRAYLQSRPAVRRANTPHDVAFPFSWRLLQRGWKLLFFRPGPFAPDPHQSARANRGAYLVTALTHCGECHTPRNSFGALKRDSALTGNPDGPDHMPVPNITPDKTTGIGDWTRDELAEMLATGTTPELGTVKGAMREAVQDSLRHLSADDRAAIADYLFAQPPVKNLVKRTR